MTVRLYDTRAQQLRDFVPLDPENITVSYGEDVTQDDAETTAAALEEAFPDAEVTVVNGGQPVYYYMISVEYLI